MDCELCGRPALHHHHVFFGTANRKQSEKWGMVAMLCPDCHTKVHLDYPLNLRMKQKYQELFEREQGREKFMAVFGRNYLE